VLNYGDVNSFDNKETSTCKITPKHLRHDEQMFTYGFKTCGVILESDSFSLDYNNRVFNDIHSSLSHGFLTWSSRKNIKIPAFV
jgi:hypothetical protein